MLTPQQIDSLDRDYSKAPVQRIVAEKFSSLLRGSVRLSRGFYRTEDEQDAYIKGGLAIKLPGYPGYRYP
jgi:hypothetical protein